MLEQPVTALPGIGKAKEQTLKKLQLMTVGDVLFSYPRAYKDFTRILSPDQASEGMTGLFFGELVDVQEKKLQKNRRLVQARLVGRTKVLNLSWFTVAYRRGSSYQYQNLSKQNYLWVYGDVKQGFYGLEIASGEIYTKEPQHKGKVPIYPLVSGITSNMRLKWIEFALKYINELYECLPQKVLENYMGRNEALKAIHFPKTDAQLEQARTRLIFEEFFIFQIGLGASKESREFVTHQSDGPLTKKYLANLPFRLTNGQLKAIADVRQDMEASSQMRRLIQGDVGSGKTVIAEYAAIKAIASQGQVAVMVPTEVLAKQMYGRMQEAMAGLDISIALLVGGTGKLQNQVRADLAAGTIQLVIGTHALISEKVEFANLTLAIVDEQHRFGVRQRIALTDKGSADLMVMSATPIPRSLALTLYGDLDTTVIYDLPHGRKMIDTRLIHPKQRDDVYRFLVSRVSAGEQGFIVFPLVEESEKLDAKAAIQEMEKLSQNQLRSVRVGLVHGQMGKEKDQIMQDYYEHKLDVLVSTTVIEVGMNVANATVMIIEDAERFGLAQLHQLRGRVGRSDLQAYCFLIADPHSEIAKQRLNVIRNTNDGFKIAEEDLRLRGPGDLLGTRQSGEPWFKLADLISDQDLLVEATQVARVILKQDPSLENYPTLLAEIKRQQQ